MYANNIYVLVGDYIEVIWAIETYLDRCQSIKMYNIQLTIWTEKNRK